MASWCISLQNILLVAPSAATPGSLSRERRRQDREPVDSAGAGPSCSSGPAVGGCAVPIRPSRRGLVDEQLVLVLEPPVAGGRGLPALERERRVGHLPAVVDATDDVVLRAPGVGEEDLAELGRAVGLGDAAHLDAGLAHRHQQVRDALVLRRVRVGAGQQEAVVGVVALRGPHLLTVDDPFVAVEHRRWSSGPARSEPESGSQKPWHQRDRALQDRRAGTPASAPRCPTAASSARRACRRRSRPRIGALARANSSASTTPCIVVRPLPPYSSGHVAQIQPPSNSFFGHSTLNVLRSVVAQLEARFEPALRQVLSSHPRISARKSSASGGYVRSMTSRPWQYHAAANLTRGSSPTFTA